MYTLEQLQQKNLKELKEIGWQLNVMPDGDRRLRRNWIKAIAAQAQIMDISIDAACNPILRTYQLGGRNGFTSEAIEQALDLVERHCYPSVFCCKTSPTEPIENSLGAQLAAKVLPGIARFQNLLESTGYPVQEPIAPAVEISPGVEVDPVQEPIAPAVKTSPFLVRNDRVRINSGLFSGMTGRVMRGGTLFTVRVEFDRRYEPSGVYHAFVGRDCLSLVEPPVEFVAEELAALVIEVQVQERKEISGFEFDRVQERKEISGFKVDSVQERKEISGFEFDRVQERKEISGFEFDRVHDPIAPAVKTPPRVTFSDWFLARYSPPQPEIHYQADADGQLSLLDFEVVATNEPPDFDDFACLDDLFEAMAVWDAENLEPLEVSLDSMVYWAPCPEEWYWPLAEDVKRCPCGAVAAIFCDGSTVTHIAPDRIVLTPCYNPHSADVCGFFLSVVKSWSQKVFPFNLCGFNVTGTCQISRNQLN